MFIVLPAYDTETPTPYSVLVNKSRVMWVTPMIEDGVEFSELHMNTAGNSGETTTLGVALSFHDVAALLLQGDKNG